MNEIAAQCMKFTPVGSRVTCNPPPMDTDIDYMVLVKNHGQFRQVMLENGFNIGGSLVLDAKSPLDDKDRFSSYVKGEINLIVTSDVSFYQRFMAATSVAKRLNLLDKSDRIALFQAVLYSNPLEAI